MSLGFLSRLWRFQAGKELVQGPKEMDQEERLQLISKLEPWMRQLLSRDHFAFSVEEICHKAESVFGFPPPSQLVRSLLKRVFGFWYRRCYWMYHNQHLGFLKCKQIQFMKLLVQLLSWKFLVINIDESSVSCAIWTNYAWINRLGSTLLPSSQASGNCSILTAIDSEGRHISLLSNDTINSCVVWLFLSSLINLYRLEGVDLCERVVFILDNAKIHRALESIAFIKACRLQFIFLPPYSPMCAPVERFFL